MPSLLPFVNMMSKVGLVQQCSDQCSSSNEDEEESCNSGSSERACSKDNASGKVDGRESESFKRDNKEGVKIDDIDGQIGQIVVSSNASILQIKVWSNMRLNLKLVFVDAVVDSYFDGGGDVAHFENAEAKGQREDGS